jgi:hypothetical protein
MFASGLYSPEPVKGCKNYIYRIHTAMSLYSNYTNEKLLTQGT